jgi:hypothetical protein
MKANLDAASTHEIDRRRNSMLVPDPGEEDACAQIGVHRSFAIFIEGSRQGGGFVFNLAPVPLSCLD